MMLVSPAHYSDSSRAPTNIIEIMQWKDLSLPTAVELLDVKGFTCYWADKAQLWRITGCMFDFYHRWHGWSNLACVHRSSSSLLAQIMEDMFVATLKSW